MRNTPQAWDELASADTSWEAAMWSQQSQRRRFELVVEWLQAEPGERLLDFGCGTGALADHLDPELLLFAWDWSPAMRLRARREHPQVFVLDDTPFAATEPRPYDHVVAIGPFNLSRNWSKRDTNAEVRRLWSLTRKTLTLSLYRGVMKPGMLSYEHTDIVRLHEDLGYPLLRLTNEHLPNDWMVRFGRVDRSRNGRHPS